MKARTRRLRGNVAAAAKSPIAIQVTVVRSAAAGALVGLCGSADRERGLLVYLVPSMDLTSVVDFVQVDGQSCSHPVRYAACSVQRNRRDHYGISRARVSGSLILRSSWPYKVSTSTMQKPKAAPRLSAAGDLALSVVNTLTANSLRPPPAAVRRARARRASRVVGAAARMRGIPARRLAGRRTRVRGRR